jgi:putative endopeptidase
MQIRKMAVALMLGLATLAAGVTAQESTPQYGKWGFDLDGADKTAQPGDDFFRYANGAWLDKTAIPADKPGYSLRLAMTDLTEQRLRDIMQAAAAPGHEPNSLEGKVGAFYKSFMDEARIDALGAKAIARQLDAVRSAKSRDDLAALMGRSSVDFEGSLFAFGTDVDLKDPKRYAVYLGQGGLGLPDRDYYLKADFAKQKAAYEAYAAKLLTLLAWKNPGTGGEGYRSLRNENCRSQLDQGAAARHQRDLQPDDGRRVGCVCTGLCLDCIPEARRNSASSSASSSPKRARFRNSPQSTRTRRSKR